ncbi:MAG: hypothetical protein EP348_10200, partial [Alphaproteobacteria bacterium]
MPGWTADASARTCTIYSSIKMTGRNKMTKWKLTGGVIALALLFCVQMPISALSAELEFKMQFASPDGTSWNKMDRRFAEQIEEITNGRAKVRFFPPNSVTPFKDWLHATGAGVLDIGFVWHPILPGKFPQMDLFSLPGLSPNQTIASIVYWRLREEFPKMGQLFTPEDNVVPLATFVAMGAHLHSREPLRTLADLKGKVFGAQDAAGVKVLKELGASASVMVGSDAYLGLQRGTIDGVLAAWGWVNNFKLNEVVKYHTLLNLNPGSYSTVMNKDTYNKLTDEEKAHLSDIRPVYFLYN